jgi:hypothetical protein
VNRLTLIPAWPGGPRDAAPLYDIKALPPAAFDAVFDAELRGESPEAYYADRLHLLAANYRVLVFPSGEMRKNWGVDAPRPLAVLGPDDSGAFRLDQANLAPGGEYAWVAVAQFETQPAGSATLWSAPLYFRTLPLNSLVPTTLAADDQSALRALGGINALQERAALGEGTALRGLALFYNFAAATDTFVCAPLDENAPCPWPDPPPSRALPFPALLQLGDIASQMLILQQAGQARPDPQRLGQLDSAIERFAGRPAAPGTPSTAGPAAAPEAKALDQLAAIGERVRALGKHEGGEQLAGLLGELGIAVDDVLGAGTRAPLPVGVASFPPYARATVRRLESLQEYAPRLQQIFSPADWSAWDTWLRQQRGELTLIAEDAERGRLSRDQLDSQIQRARGVEPPAYPDKWRFLDPASGAVDIEHVSRLQPAATSEWKRLLRELYWFQLTRFAGQLWPARQ